MSKIIDQHYINRSMTYTDYRTMIDQLLANGKTTGDNHSEEMLEYTRLNESRMKRLDKTTRLNEESQIAMQQIDRSLIWLVITEGWCGDAAQIIPVLQKLADTNDQVELRLILRDENLELMDAFLTNGARSIPQLIGIDAESKEVLYSWGPRPEEAQGMVMAVKKELMLIDDPVAHKKRYQESQNELHLWYARDKTQSIQKEVLSTIQKSLMTGADKE